MAERKVYWVKPRPDGRWEVALEGSKRPSSVHDRKADAYNAGRAKAKAAKLGQLMVQRKDGTIQTEHTYGKDPVRSKG